MAKLAGGGPSLAIQDIWNSVALEERLELIAKSQASGIIAATITVFIVSSIGYGLDNIWFVAAAIGSGFFVFPLFSSQTWRSGKPSLILAYLAIRTVSRRYAHVIGLTNIDLILVYKGTFEEVFNNREDKELHLQSQSIDFNNQGNADKEVWIILLKGGLLVLSEKRGGAKLEFATPIIADTIIEQINEKDSQYSNYIIHGSSMSKGRSARLGSKYTGAHYVFLKRFQALVFEAQKSQETLEKLRQTGTP